MKACPDLLPETGFIRLKTVMELIPIGKSKIYADIKKGTFPAPVKIGRVSLWRVEDIRDFINQFKRRDEASQNNQANLRRTE